MNFLFLVEESSLGSIIITKIVDTYKTRVRIFDRLTMYTGGERLELNQDHPREKERIYINIHFPRITGKQ